MNKEKQIRMLLHPERYSDGQLDRMFEENRIPVPDVDEEWHQFKSRNFAPRKLHRPMRWVAILMVAAALSGITYAAIHHLRQERREKVAEVVENTQKPTVQKDGLTLTIITEGNDTVRQDQLFNNVELQQIMNQLSHDFGLRVVFKNESKRTLRFYLKWEADDSLQEIINRINHFDKVHLSLSDTTITIE